MATLYRKYRPQTFKEIVGQEHVVETLKKAIELDRIAHAYIFSGARGVGKTTLARLMAKAVNCLSDKNRPCGECKNCKDIATGKFVDLVEIDAASNRGIDEMRDLRDRVQFSPSVGKKRVYIIDEVHMLTREAFNALLKTLEEPPAHTVFVFATTEIHKVPATILSRCQRFDFLLGDEAMIKENVSSLAEQEGLKITPDVLDLIAYASGGSFRDAQSILDQLSSHLQEKELSQEEAAKLLNLSGFEQINKFIDILEKKDLEGAIKFLSELRSKSMDFVSFSDGLIKEYRSRMISAIEKDEDVSSMKKVLEILVSSKAVSKNSPIDSLALELAAIEICNISDKSEVISNNLQAKNGDKSEAERQNSKEKYSSQSEKSSNEESEEDEGEKQAEGKGEDKKKKNKSSKEDKKKKDTENTAKKIEKDNPDQDYASQTKSVELEDVSSDQRNAIIEVLSGKNMALATLLRLAEWKVDRNKLIFSVEYPIYKEKIMSEKSKKILEACVDEVLGEGVAIGCEVDREEGFEDNIEAVFNEGI